MILIEHLIQRCDTMVKIIPMLSCLAHWPKNPKHVLEGSVTAC